MIDPPKSASLYHMYQKFMHSRCNATPMSKAAWGRKTEEDVQENIDQAVDEAAELDFASLDEIREAFSE